MTHKSLTLAKADFHEAIDGLESLIEFVRMACGADMVFAYEANEAGLATPLAASPPARPQPFMLGENQIENIDWSNGAVDADRLRLPAPVLLALGLPAKNVQFLPTPIPEAPRSGIMLLWVERDERDRAGSSRSDAERGIPMLTQVFTQMLTERRNGMQRRLMTERFHDLFESVPTGIVVLDGDCGTGLINEPAATLLGIPAGEVEAVILAASMRPLRQSCVNASELQTAYGAFIGDPNYAATMLWDLGDRQFKVDTHAMRGDRRNGRIWLFNEVTAEHRLEQELRGLALTDPLTGLANRRQFAEYGAAMFDQAESDAQQLSVLMLDVDHFKSINDSYGHHVGDEVLRTLANLCQSQLRTQDLIARLGGEEFAVILPGTSTSDATVIAQRLRAAIAAAPIIAQDLQIDVTVSIGGATLLPGYQTLEDLLDRADHRLYVAKQTGRNKVEFTG